MIRFAVLFLLLLPGLAARAEAALVADLSADQALALYDRHLSKTQALMEAKNHDYGGLGVYQIKLQRGFSKSLKEERSGKPELFLLKWVKNGYFELLQTF